MVAISFSESPSTPQMILDGTKDQTIRPYNAERYDQIKHAKELQLYWKQRAKEGYKIADAELVDIFRIKFDRENMVSMLRDDQIDDYYIPLTPMEIQEIVSRNGFINFWDLWDALEEIYGDIESMEFMVIRWALKKE